LLEAEKRARFSWGVTILARTWGKQIRNDSYSSQSRITRGRVENSSSEIMPTAVEGRRKKVWGDTHLERLSLSATKEKGSSARKLDRSRRSR